MAERTSKLERQLDAVLGVASSIILIVLMLLTTADVISRYALNWSIRGSFELTEILLLVLIFAGLPLVSHADEHVTMDFIDRMLGKKTVVAVIRLVHLLCAAVLLFLAYLIWRKANAIAGYGDTTDVLRIAVSPFVYFMAVMIFVTGLIHIYKIVVPGEPRTNQISG